MIEVAVHDMLCEQVIVEMHDSEVSNFSWWGTIDDGTVYQLIGRRVEPGELATGTTVPSNPQPEPSIEPA